MYLNHTRERFRRHYGNVIWTASIAIDRLACRNRILYKHDFFYNVLVNMYYEE